MAARGRSRQTAQQRIPPKRFSSFSNFFDFSSFGLFFSGSSLASPSAEDCCGDDVGTEMVADCSAGISAERFSTRISAVMRFENELVDGMVAIWEVATLSAILNFIRKPKWRFSMSKKTFSLFYLFTQSSKCQRYSKTTCLLKRRTTNDSERGGAPVWTLNVLFWLDVAFFFCLSKSSPRIVNHRGLTHIFSAEGKELDWCCDLCCQCCTWNFMLRIITLLAFGNSNFRTFTQSTTTFSRSKQTES